MTPYLKDGLVLVLIGNREGKGAQTPTFLSIRTAAIPLQQEVYMGFLAASQ